MNPYTLRHILNFIRSQGKLPKDQIGQILPVSDLLAWFGLSECLTKPEQLFIEKDLAAMVEAELSIEQLKQLAWSMSVFFDLINNLYIL